MTTVVADDEQVVDLRERRRKAAGGVLAVAVLVPVLLFGWRALRAPVNFDGAMNLQVATRLTDGEGYTRRYGDVEAFPHEVQTNGPYIYVAALAVAVLGPGQLGYQAANLLFVGAVAATVVLLLRERHPLLRAVAPVLVLLGVPSIAVYALGGLGEVPTTSFLLAAVLALAAALRAPERAPQWVFGASVAFGAALATKTFAIGAAAGLGAGLVAVLLAAPTRRERGRVALATAGVVLVPAVRELHKLVSLGSVGEYRAWWDVERRATSDQTGLEGTGGNLVSTFLDHLDELARQVGSPAPLLAVVLFLPLVWVAAVVAARARRDGLRPALRDPHLAVLVMLAGLAGLYTLWWLCLLPESKLWVRRMLPGLVALHVLYLLMVPALVGELVEVVRRGRRWPGAAAAVGLVAVLVAAVPYGWDRLDRNTRDIVEGEPEWLAAEEDAAAQVRAGDDLRWYGDGWWSAPGVSLLARTDLRDLADVAGDCDFDPDRDRLVWDLDARLIVGHPSTRDGELELTEVANHGGRVRIYAIGCG